MFPIISHHQQRDYSDNKEAILLPFFIRTTVHHKVTDERGAHCDHRSLRGDLATGSTDTDPVSWTNDTSREEQVAGSERDTIRRYARPEHISDAGRDSAPGEAASSERRVIR